VRVAAFATWDGKIPAGKTNAEPIHMVDWYPTLLKLCGAKTEQKLPLDGLDIWPTLTQGKPTPHADILLNTTPTAGAVRAGNWKLVVKGGEDDPDGGAAKPAKEVVELFDLKADPYEKANLAEKHPDKVKELKATLAGYAKQAVPPKAKPKPADFKVPKVWGEKE
jgi:arylsulfatase A-like enzyme